MKTRKTLFAVLGLLSLLSACSKHEDQLRAEGLREISGKIFVATEGQPDMALAQVVVVAVDWDECVQNFKKLKEKRSTGKGQGRLEPEDYWQVLGSVVKGVKTDSAGKFEMTVPAKKSLALCASATYNSAGSEIVRRYWMIRLNEGTVQHFELSNRNSLRDAQVIEEMVLLN